MPDVGEGYRYLVARLPGKSEVISRTVTNVSAIVSAVYTLT